MPVCNSHPVHTQCLTVACFSTSLLLLSYTLCLMWSVNIYRLLWEVLALPPKQMSRLCFLLVVFRSRWHSWHCGSCMLGCLVSPSQCAHFLYGEWLFLFYLAQYIWSVSGILLHYLWIFHHILTAKSTIPLLVSVISVFQYFVHISSGNEITWLSLNL